MFKIKKLDIDIGHYKSVFVHKLDAQSLGIYPMEKVEVYSVENPSQCITARFDIVNPKKKNLNIRRGEILLSKGGFEKLELKEGEKVDIKPISIHRSFEHVKRKWHGETLAKEEIIEIMTDISDEKYSEAHTAYFMLACEKEGLNDEEVAAATLGLVNSGEVLKFEKDLIVADKHCIGGIPNNRTTPIIVPIIATFDDVRIPNTFTKAITSSAATADVVGTYIDVSKDIDEMMSVINETNGCLVWGGGIDMAPGDDVIIQVGRPLNIDSQGQMIASILAKKLASGLTHLLLDIPYGREAKALTLEAAEQLKSRFEKVSEMIGLNVKVVITSGEIPVGRGIGPIAEMIDVLSILKNEPDAPQDLRERSLYLAGNLIHFIGKSETEKEGIKLAEKILESGQAYEKFKEIRDAQGGYELKPLGKYSFEIKADFTGIVSDIDNRIIKRVNKISGAPLDSGAAIILHKNCDSGKCAISEGEVLYTIHSNNKDKLNSAREYIEEKGAGFLIED